MRYAVILLHLFVIGCAPARFYEGPVRSPDEVAIFAASVADDAQIVAIDGRTLYMPEVAVLPGMHTILIHLSGKDLEGYELDSYCAASFEAESGMIYGAVMRAKHKSTAPVATRTGYGHRVMLQAGVIARGSKELAARCTCFSKNPYECE